MLTSGDSGMVARAVHTAGSTSIGGVEHVAAGVVDELRLVIAPTIAGRGRRLLDGLPAIRLESIRSTTSPTGHLLVDYRVIG